jgi:hypothetical protein
VTATALVDLDCGRAMADADVALRVHLGLLCLDCGARRRAYRWVLGLN